MKNPELFKKPVVENLEPVIEIQDMNLCIYKLTGVAGNSTRSTKDKLKSQF